MLAVPWAVLAAASVGFTPTGTIDTFILSYFFTGSLKLAGSIAFTEVATKLVLFYLHERAWDRISWGRSKKRQTALRSKPLGAEATA